MREARTSCAQWPRSTAGSSSAAPVGVQPALPASCRCGKDASYLRHTLCLRRVVDLGLSDGLTLLRVELCRLAAPPHRPGLVASRRGLPKSHSTACFLPLLALGRFFRAPRPRLTELCKEIARDCTKSVVRDLRTRLRGLGSEPERSRAGRTRRARSLLSDSEPSPPLLAFSHRAARAGTLLCTHAPSLLALRAAPS